MSQYLILPTDKDIQHHGILGMSWGKRNGPPYPLNASGRRALRKQRKAEKAEIVAKKKEEAEKKKEEKFQEKKHKVLMGGSAAEVMKWQGKWTNEELKKIVDRLDYEAKIMDRIPKEKTAQDKLKEATEAIGNMANFGEKGANLWNVIARYYNASGSGKSNPMPYIPKAGQKQEKEKKKKSSAKPYKNNFDNWDWDYD